MTFKWVLWSLYATLILKRSLTKKLRLVSWVPWWLSITQECYESVHCTTQLESEFRVGSDSGFSSCAAPTYYCRSEYFYSQCPQVQKSIGTEHCLNRDKSR